jgi:hypothetical protein
MKQKCKNGDACDFVHDERSIRWMNERCAINSSINKRKEELSKKDVSGGITQRADAPSFVPGGGARAASDEMD